MFRIIIITLVLAFTHKTTAIFSSNSETNNTAGQDRQANRIALLTDTLDLRINVDEKGTFDVYLSRRPSTPIRIRFSCDTPSKLCSTFDGSQLKPIELTPDDYRKTMSIVGGVQGHDVILLDVDSANVTLDETNAYVRLAVARGKFWTVLSAIFGWAYFVIWALSFYPQNIHNYRRKSVVGLSPDYTVFHFTGFLFYVIFNLGLYYSPTVQEQYEEKYPRSEIPVELNDVVYAIHAVFISGVTFVQYFFIYEKGEQRLSLFSKTFQAIAWIGGAILTIVVLCHKSNWLTLIYYFSYLKLIVTAIKYMPQVWFNFRKKSTKGWSINMILLDFSGGTLSMLQMITISINYADWRPLIGNLPKFGLALSSAFFDVVSMVQHYILYGDVPVYSNGKRRSTLKPAGDSCDMLCDSDFINITIPGSVKEKSQAKY